MSVVELVPGGVRASYAAGHVLVRSEAASFGGLSFEEWAARAGLGPKPAPPAPVVGGREYGPHRPEDAPATVTVLGPERWPQKHEEPYPAALLAQREQLNELARRGQ